MRVDYLIAGAGFSGCTLAERLANELNKKVLIVEKRDHIGGNAYDCFNDDGIRIQVYGPHIFHTKIKRVWDYLNRFTTFNNYVHRVLSHLKEMEVYFPINLDTMEKITGHPFTPESLKDYFEKKRIPMDEKDIKNSRDVVMSQVGEEVYELFVKHYTKKQWGIYPEELDPQVLRRIPVRYNRDTRYFDDPWQGIPTHGYTKIFENMVKSDNIHILLNTDYRDVLDSVTFDKLIYTGPVDDYFDYIYGKLPYRTMRFEFETLDMERFQAAAVVNYPRDNEFTRITESKHFYFQEHPQTTICYEYSQSHGDPYYPVPRAENRGLYEQYKAAVDKLKNTYFIGRLAQYKYINMDQAVNNALELFDGIANGRLKR
ncbi:MAG: UDP-galactopyranose mutase [bacterium]|nr:UDP-galactopyranose mutase [bacterium]